MVLKVQSEDFTLALIPRFSSKRNASAVEGALLRHVLGAESAANA